MKLRRTINEELNRISGRDMDFTLREMQVWDKIGYDG